MAGAVRQQQSRWTDWLPGLLLVLLIGLMISAAQAREPMQDLDSLIPVELATVGVDPFSGAPVVILRAPESGDIVPITIGSNEAMAIMRALGSVEMPRPMTHDTAIAMMEALQGELYQVMVDGLVGNSYHGVLDIRREDDPDTPIYVDTRPSDALALAVRTGARILVAPDVLQAASGRGFEGLGDDQLVTALGITVGNVTETLREELNLPEQDGLLVVRVLQQAREAGIEPGALILTVNGETPESALEFLRLVQRTESGEPAVIRFWLDGEEHEVSLDTDVPDTRRDDRPAPGQQLARLAPAHVPDLDS